MGEENGATRTWKKRLATFDFEVTAYDWLVVIKVKQTGEYYPFHNDPVGLEKFISEHDYIYVGYNNKHYDNYILKGILHHYIPEDIKKINDWIIAEGKNGWEYPFEDPYLVLPPTCDISLDIVPMRSLKECEGNMCMNIQESTIDFNIDHPWSKEEFEEMLFYCKHDVDANERLIDERMSYLEAKATLAEMCGYPIEKALYKTNGQMVAISLGAEKKEWNDENEYIYPDSVDFDLVPKEVITFFNRVKDTGTKEKFLYELAGCPHTYGLGGLHGALSCYVEKSTKDRVMVIRDVRSYYPTLLIFYGYLSRNVKDPKIYVAYYTDRLHFKEIGDKKKAKALKLPLNIAYGISLQEFNDMFDPLMGRSTCITGQVLLTQLVVELNENIEEFKLIQSNTDGIVYSLPRSEKSKADSIVEKWSKKTHLEMEEDVIDLIVQKDVNNYIVKFDNGKVKNKGAYVSNYPNGTFDSNSLTITHEAIVKYFIEGTPVEETINDCDDVFKFQLIAKTGSTYDSTVHYINGEEIQVQKVNRLYAIKDEKYGVVKKVKKQYLELDEDGERRYYINLKGNRTYKKKWETDDKGDFFIKKDTTQNCPEHAIIDNCCKITIDTIDKEWYIKLARKRINDFLGIKGENKGGNKIMTSVAKKAVEPKVALYKKIYDLGIYLSKQPYIADGYNDLQSYEYVGSDYYREVLGRGCREVGLIFKFNVANRIFTPLEKTKNMNLTTILGSISFIDIDTGEHEDYTVMGDGSDNLDKGIYKAETMMIKYFVLNNFLLPKVQDEIDPESGKEDKKAAEPLEIKVESTKKDTTTKASSTPITKEERKEVAKEVVNNNSATKEYVEEMVALIDKIQATGVQTKGKPYGESTKVKLLKVLNGEMELTKVEAVSMMTKIEEKADGLGID